ncbi:MAG: hypothetical protein WD426_15785 [Anditalea sp.]
MMEIGYACMQWPDRNQADRRETAGPVRGKRNARVSTGRGKVFGFLQERTKVKLFSQREISL